MNYSRKRLCKPRADEGISFHQFPGLFFFNGDLVVFKIFVYLILTVQDLGGCLGFSLVGMSRGGVWAFHCGTFSFCKARALGCIGFSSWGTWAWLLHDMWDLSSCTRD